MELRRFRRAPIRRPVLFAPKDDDAFSDGMSVDISLGGMFIATEFPRRSARRSPSTRRSTGAGELVLPAIVRWTRPDGMGVQFQLLGARETFAITEIVRLFREEAR